MQAYLEEVAGDDAILALTSQRQSSARRLAGVTEPRAAHRYAEGKWSVREVVGHVSDTERVFAYRILRFARGDSTPLPGFDENEYVRGARFERRPFADVLAEWITVRAATLVLVHSLDAQSLPRHGIANGRSVSVAGLAWMIAGHEAHHMRILQERYGIE